jgi:MerR family transcriptional regulator, heat shock protein HspR
MIFGERYDCSSIVRAMSEDYYYRKQVLELFDCDEEFIERLETEELVRSVKMDRVSENVFPTDQVDLIRIINLLVHDLEVNLPGVEVILEMRANMIRMQEEFDLILEALAAELKKRRT